MRLGIGGAIGGLLGGGVPGAIGGALGGGLLGSYLPLPPTDPPAWLLPAAQRHTPQRYADLPLSAKEAEWERWVGMGGEITFDEYLDQRGLT